jgi:hypothetical protein
LRILPHIFKIFKPKKLKMRNVVQPGFALITACLLALGAQAQPGSGMPAMPGGLTPPGGATAPKSGPKPYKEVITDKAKSSKGLFTVHKIEDKYFFEMGDSVMNRDILIVTRLSKAPADNRIGGFLGYSGDDVNENVIRFEKGPNNKVFLRNISFTEYVKDSSKPMYKNVQRSNVQPIAAAFDVKAWSKDSMGAVIDVTDYMSGDNDILFFAGSRKSILRVGGFQPDKSYIVDVKTYPVNTEIKTVKTYSKSAGSPFGGPVGFGGGTPPSGNLTFEINTSILLLPKTPMQPRYFDDRVAYFTTSFTDFDADPQGVKDVDMITRWRLEVKDEDMEKFKNGELVEPKKPIVYYIDPTTPEKWVPYLMQGVDDWKASFEKAGFKNAIMAKRAPTKQQDSTWSLEDARYSAIVYKPSDVANASGPHVGDPRSGEILESHINWYHNVMRLVRNWYLIQASPSDPQARKAQFSDELMGQLIRFVSSHEVGHTLGLPHNMGSSSATPVEKLRDKAWVEANGHTSSIMDYARFNYVAQPGDNIGQVGLFPRIGDYDHWSIEWGYKPLPGKTEAQEKEILNDWVKSKYSNPRLRFISQDGVDPRAQTESVGDDNIKASEYGVKNLKWILPQLPAWLNEKAENYTTLTELYGEVVTQFQRYAGHVATNIGGIYTNSKTTDQEGGVFSIVPKETQKTALAYLQKQVFETPAWLLNKDILDRISTPGSDRVSSMQDGLLGSLLNGGRLSRMVNAAARDANAYRIDEYIDDLKKGVWSELATDKAIDQYRRNLQKSFVERMGVIVNPPPPQVTSLGPGITLVIGGDNKKNDLISVAKGVLRGLKTEVTAAIARTADKMSKYHLQDVLERINNVLNPK